MQERGNGVVVVGYPCVEPTNASADPESPIIPSSEPCERIDTSAAASAPSDLNPVSSKPVRRVSFGKVFRKSMVYFV